jgi:hypothetical protein
MLSAANNFKMPCYHKWLVLLIGIFSLNCSSDKPTVFTKITPKQSGINFANQLTESDSFNIFTFEYIYNGGGVGIGDFNNDNLPDLYFTGNSVSSRLYINIGDFKFDDVTAISGTATKDWCTGVAVIDINSDGWKDIYVSTAYTDPKKPAPNLAFLNKGLNKDGIPEFEEVAAQLGLNDSAYGTQAAFLDYDLDGDLDVYLCINSGKESDRNQLRGQRADGTGLSQDKLFRNDGTPPGTDLPHFTNVSREAGIQTEGWGLGVIVKDINRDGWPDVYVANDYQSNDHLYINNKDGTFTNKIAQYLAHQCHNAMGVDIADYNNDGLEDICVVDMLPDDNLRQKTMFGAVPNEKYAAALRMGYQPQFVRNVLQLNNGLLPDSSGTVAFSDIGYMAGIAATDWSWSPLWADFDMDGWRDLLITNGYVKDITDLDFTTFATEYKMFGTTDSLMKQLKEKAKEIGEVKKKNWLFQNNGNLTFSDKAVAWGLDEPSFSNGAAYADLDNDGDLDIVINNLNAKAFVYRNNTIGEKQEKTAGALPHYITFKLIGETENRDGLGARLTIWTSGHLQYAEHALQRGYLSNVDDQVHFGLGKEAIVDSILIEWPSGKKQKLYNIEADQKLLLKETDAGMDVLKSAKPAYLLKDVTALFRLSYSHEENDYLDFLYQYTIPHRFSIQGPSLAVGDVDGDGLEDFYTGGSSRHSGYFFVQHKTGFTVKQFIKDPENKRQEETGTLLFDADGDGDSDLYCVAGGNEFGDSAAYQDMLFVNDGKGNFSDASAALPNTSASGSCVVAADYDNDGDLDLFIGGRTKPHTYPLPGRSYLLRNDTDPNTHAPRFTDITAQACSALVAPGMVTAALWTDYDNDGFADLMIAGEFMAVQLYRNSNGVKFDQVMAPAFSNTHGWYNSLAAADFDNDGDMDYIAGNLGLNTRYKASPKAPVTVRYNDYNKDGALDAFLFAYNGDKEYPVHTRTTVVEQITSLKKKIYYYTDYGKAGYTELFTTAEQQGAKEMKAVQMSSLYIENNGAGNFNILPLPALAQLSPMFGIVPFDVDGDGNLDVIALGNSYAPEALSGRYDASIGWVLKGNGHGAFMPLQAGASGFAVRGDAKAFVRLNQNNQSCLLIASRNSGPLQVYKAGTLQQCIPLSKSDLYAIHELRNGKKRKEEFFYGSSYLSQSGRFVTIDSFTKGISIHSQQGTVKKFSFNERPVHR